MRLLVRFGEIKKIIYVDDKSAIMDAVKNEFQSHILDRNFTVECYDKIFDEYINLEYAEIEDHGKLLLITNDSLGK